MRGTGSRQRPHQPDPAGLGQGVTTARIAIDMDLAGRSRGLEEGLQRPKVLPAVTCSYAH